MQIKGKIPLLIIAVLTWIVIISSCANQGMPTGGPRDSVPPVLVETDPEYRETNFDGDKVSFTFNEYIIPDAVSELLVISPPLEKRPVIRTKGKSLIVQFNEELRDSTTYSMDFKNSISDNNERNPYENLRFSFSTGNVYDSLRVAGKVMNSFNLEPVENTLVMLHKNLHDSAAYTVRPEYIAKTDDNGLFLIDNIAPGEYHLFSINDANNDLMYNEGAEEIAFHDTIIVPSAHYHEELDTLVEGVDSMLVLGYTHFSPEPVYLRQFTEDIFDQYLETYKRETRYKCNFIFNESVKDTFNIRLVGIDADNWYLLEPNNNADTLSLWIADTTVAKVDTLFMELSYFQLDSIDELYLYKDTLELTFTEIVKEELKKKRRKKDDEEDKPDPVPQFLWKTNIGSTFEVNKDILLSSPEPLATFDSSSIILYNTQDTLKTPLAYSLEKDSTMWRTYRLKHKWEFETEYTLEIDSAASMNIYGITSKKFSKKFTTREEDYYGTVLLSLSNVPCPMVIQLLKNNDQEDVIYERRTDTDGTVIFDFLLPEKYKIKLIYDENGNGKWDVGSFQDRYQSEKVAYINKVVKVRSNFEEEFIWDLTLDLTFTKNIRDLELEEQRRKEAEERAREERENPERPRLQNDMMQGGSGRMFER